MKMLLIFITIFLVLILAAPNISFAQHRSAGTSHSQSRYGRHNNSFVGRGHGGTSHSRSYYGHSYGGHSDRHSYYVHNNYGHRNYHGHAYSHPYSYGYGYGYGLPY
jgi:hypothetical protein